ncbi:MAG: S8 family serine peptidase [Eubacterium sp.]|nr:S8 family serine peptidase [Eubacterium sp.]
MNNKKTVYYILVLFCLLAALFRVPVCSIAVRAADDLTQSIKTEEAAGTEESGPERIEELSDYKEISETLYSEQGKEEFGSILISDTSDTEIRKDGETERLEEEFNTSRGDARQALQSEAALKSYLEKNDPETIYQVEKNEQGDIEVKAPYQTKRLIIDRILTRDLLGASRVYYNRADSETILEFETQEQTREAYNRACRKYGSSRCFVDELYYFGDILKSSETGLLPPAAFCLSWGNRYMQMNQLKSRAAYYGYNKQVTVAVIDSGVNRSYFLFEGDRIRSDSYNFAAANTDVSDSIGHGTHVSGIIADATPENVKILALKVTDKRGRASLYLIRNALRYAVRKKVQVINLSMGVTGKRACRYKYLNGILKKARQRGIPVCSAAGNDGVSIKYSYPANTGIPIIVSAINSNGGRGSFISRQTGKRKYYSNYGNTVDFAAPGTQIVSAYVKGQFAYMTGTSMAVPHVSAAIAYIKMMNPGISTARVEKQLRSMSVDLGTKGKDKYFGWGCPKMGNLFSKGLIKSDPAAKKKSGQGFTISLANKKRGILISWKKIKTAKKYIIYRKVAGGRTTKIGETSSGKQTFVDSKVSGGKKYTYKVKAIFGKRAGRSSQGKGILRTK